MTLHSRVEAVFGAPADSMRRSAREHILIASGFETSDRLDGIAGRL
jgi:hypothetical protein